VSRFWAPSNREDSVVNADSYLALSEQLASSYRRQGAILIQDNAWHHKGRGGLDLVPIQPALVGGTYWRVGEYGGKTFPTALGGTLGGVSWFSPLPHGRNSSRRENQDRRKPT